MFYPDLLSSIVEIGQRIIGCHSETPDSFEGLRLSYAVSNNQSFSILNSLDLFDSGDSADIVRGVTQNIPRFLPHVDTDSVINSWKATVLGDHLASYGFERSDLRYWVVEPKLVPNITDKQTVLTLAKLAANAYVPIPHQGDWSEVNGTDNGNWTHEGPGYGWDDDGLRGYVFTTADEELMVLSIKGTSTAVWNDGGPTAPNDKMNDNAFFSCCCGRVNRMWTPVCDCYLGDNTCDEQCLDEQLVREDRYYSQLLDVYENARKLVPKAKHVWVTGHSLGGALASMLGRTYGLPVVTFEAPGEQLPINRLHLPVPPGIPPWEDYIWHFGHNSDPIFLGTCQGSRSTCALKGYAMETKCHSGLICMYDTKHDLGWYESVSNHRIHVVIDNVLEKYDEPATCIFPEPCEDCPNWVFLDPLLDLEPYPSSTAEPSKSTSVTKHPKTSTIKETSTVTITSPAITSPVPTECETSSCVSRHWYGECAEWTTYETDLPTETTCIKRNWNYMCEEYATITATQCP